MGLLALAVGGASTETQRAELIFFNGHIFTGDAADRTVDSLAVADERILEAGSRSAIDRYAGPGTVRIDLRGNSVIPGLIDTHTHALEWATGVVRGELDLAYPGTRSIEDILKAVRERIRGKSPGEWITGGAWDDAMLAERRYPTRADLDAVAPLNPVILWHLSGHLSVANSAALKLAGITGSTEAPQGGEIELDPQGEPTGVLKDTATQLVYRIVPQPDIDDADAVVDFLSRAAAQAGLTTIHDVALTRDEVAIYQRVHRRHPIRIRVLMAPLVRAAQDVDWLRELGVHTGSGDPHLKFGYAKMFADGGMGAATIAIYPPGIGDGTNLGLLIWKTDELERVQRQLVDLGWQLGTHAIGDRAIDQVLDSYEKISAQNPGRDLRHRVVHCGIATPAIQRRLAHGHVLVDSNPAFVYWIGSWFLKYGSERLRYSYPARSYVEQGIVASAGSDVNVTPLSPWSGIWAAVERRELASGAVLAPEERIPVREALRMYTQNGAYAGFEEQDKGSLETGKFADFVVLDRDPLVIPSAQLKDVRVLATFVGGVAAYDTGLAGPANRSAGTSR